MRHLGRPKGQSGWVYKKGGIYMLRWRERKMQADGSLRIVQLSKSLGYFRTKSEARIAAELEMRKINAAIQNPQSCTRLADFVEHQYFPHVEKRLRPSTVHSYKRLWSDYMSSGRISSCGTSAQCMWTRL
jgi:hypothetical protein